jgi:sugar/nucleoside kinase (ribokinase family)
MDANLLTKKYSLLAAGELLADLIGTEPSPDLLDARHFGRQAGGSPANLAANLARLGHAVALVACVGQDALGTYLIGELAAAGVDTSYLARDDQQPTSLVLVSRTQGTPDFIAYRGADARLLPAHFTDRLLEQAEIFHTTCFALSREPARSSILEAAERCRQLGTRLSLDANYAPALWPDRRQAQRVLVTYVPDALVKLSEDDAERLFGQPVETELVLNYFHGHGAELVCYTLGAAGSVVSWDGGEQQVTVPAEPVTATHATGAGDAYWAGFLAALLAGQAPDVCARAGARMAALKLGSPEPLPHRLSPDFLFA